jgi:hypothetical protein
MRYLRLLALVGACLASASFAQAQLSVGIGIGVPAAPVVVGPAPLCAYGYYSYYPYACAPYGYYGPSWFSGGIFIGAGPWFHGYYGHPGYWGRPVYGRPGYVGRPGVYARPIARPYANHGSVNVGHGPTGNSYHNIGSVRGGSVGGSFHGGGRR